MNREGRICILGMLAILCPFLGIYYMIYAMKVRNEKIHSIKVFEIRLKNPNGQTFEQTFEVIENDNTTT